MMLPRYFYLLISAFSLIPWAVGQGQVETPVKPAAPASSIAPYDSAPADEPAQDPHNEQAEEWIQLFNGVDLTGWTPKIVGHAYGENYADTFRVVDGLLTTSYDKYVDADFESQDGTHQPKFDKFGHLFYKDSFSHYILRAEYRFIGDQVKNGQGWAVRNNGFMLHGQDGAKMELMQPFPVSVEAQLLGGIGDAPRSTLNLCTPGTHVVLNGELFKQHCTSSSSPTFAGDQWVTVEIEVHGGEKIKHLVGGQIVLEYSQPQYDETDQQTPQAAAMIVDGNRMIDHGTISIQSESAPTQFRKIELKPLEH